MFFSALVLTFKVPDTRVADGILVLFYYALTSFLNILNYFCWENEALDSSYKSNSHEMSSFIISFLGEKRKLDIPCHLLGTKES